MGESALRDLAVNVAGLDNLVRHVHEGRLGVLEEGQSLLLDQVTNLQKAVDELTKAAEERSIDWITIDDIDLAVDLLVSLHKWVQRVYIKYRQINPCWAWHAPVVAELLAMRAAHGQAYKGKGADRISRWLTDRPRIGDRIDSEHLASCGPEHHRHEGSSYYAEVEELGAYARYWASCWGDERAGLPPGLTLIVDQEEE